MPKITKKHFEDFLPEEDKEIFGLLEEQEFEEDESKTDDFEEEHQLKEHLDPQDQLLQLLEEKIEEIKEEILETVENFREYEKMKLFSYFEKTEEDLNDWKSIFLKEILFENEEIYNKKKISKLNMYLKSKTS